MSNEPKLSERLRALKDQCIKQGECHSIPNETAHWLMVGAVSEIDECIVQAEAIEAREPKAMPTYLSRDYEALYDLLCKGGEALGYVIFQRLTGPASKRAMRATRMLNGTTLLTGDDVYETLSLHRNAFNNECQHLNLEWVAPLDRSREAEDLQTAYEAAAEVDRAGGDAPHAPVFGLAAWIRARFKTEHK